MIKLWAKNYLIKMADAITGVEGDEMSLGANITANKFLPIKKNVNMQPVNSASYATSGASTVGGTLPC